MKHTIAHSALAAALTVLVAGCGGIVERATEEAVERAVEEAVEADTGGDVDIEFNEDGISVESDEGGFSVNVDENGVEIDGTDADGNDFSLDADEDGTFTATDADGDVTTGEVSGDGDSVDFTVEGEDGDAVLTSGEGIPTEWPSDVPEPAGLDEVFGTYISDAGVENVIVTGTAGGSAKDVFDDYTGRLADAGFTEEQAINQGDEFYSATFTNDGTTVTVTMQGSGDSTNVIIGVN